MKDWLESYYIAQQTLEGAETSQGVIEALRDILAWLLGSEATLDIWRSPVPELLPPLARDAFTTLRPQASDDGTQVVIPLLAEEDMHGLVNIQLGAPVEPHKIGLASALAHLAARRLSQLLWPASPRVFRQLVENANVAIDVAGLDGKITYANLTAAQLYGYETPEALIGHSVSELYYGDEEQRIARDIVSETRTQSGWTGDVAQQDTSGNPLPVRLAVFGLRDHQNRMTSYGAIAQNLGEQQRLLISLKQQTRRLHAAAEVARATISKLDLESLLIQVVSVAQTLFNYDLVSVLLVEGDQLVIKVVYSSHGRLIPRNPGLPIDSTSLNGWVALHGRSALVNDVSQDARYREMLDMPSTASELVIPLRLGDRVIGTLDIQSAQMNTFQIEDAQTLQGIADQLAVAVDNARLFAAERIQVKQLAALNTISQTLVAAYNFEDVWAPIYEQINGLFNVSTFFVMRYDAATDMLHFLWLVMDGKQQEPEPPIPLAGLSGLVIRTGAPLLLYDIPVQEEWLKSQGAEPQPIHGKREARSWMGVPLRARDGTIMGLISIQSKEPHAFRASDQQLLVTIATQVSLAMENARLVNQLSNAAAKLKERARRIESLYRIGTLLSTSLDRNQILAMAAEQIVKLLHVDHCGVALLGGNNTEAYVVAEYPPTLLQNLTIPVYSNQVYSAPARQDVFICNDIATDPRLEGVRAQLLALNVQALLVVQLTSKGKLIGSIGLSTFGRRRDFTDGEIETCRTLATQVALAVDNSNLYAEALAANELKSQFLATMSHELRTPLNAILGYTEMVIAGVYGALTEKQKDRLQRVYANARHLLELINDVLDLAKIESGRMTLTIEQVDLKSLVASALTYIAPQAEAKHLQLISEIPDRLPAVTADSIRLRQIIINLLSNAVKFTREGYVSIRALPLTVVDGTCQENALPGVTLNDGRWLAVSVEDTGIGIARENFELIFDAFRQVDGSSVREYEGTGLGLAITRQLVEMQGGKLWLESEIGRGSVFTFALPVAAELELKPPETAGQ